MSFKFAIPALAFAAAVATPAMADVPVYAPIGVVNIQAPFSYTAPIEGELAVYYLGGKSVGYTSALFASINGGAWQGPAQLSNSDTEGSRYSFGVINGGDTVDFKLRIFAPGFAAGNEIFSDPSLNLPGGRNLLFYAPWNGGSFTYVDSFFGPLRNGSIAGGTYTFVAFEDILSPRREGTNNQDYDYNDYRFAFRLENVVPEPATWAMMIAGFGLVGFAMRRRKDGLASVSA
jgi:hypothetical protein